MFYGCSGITHLNVSSFDTSKLSSQAKMFGNCTNLTSLDVSGFDTSHIRDMSGLLAIGSKLLNFRKYSFFTS